MNTDAPFSRTGNAVTFAATTTSGEAALPGDLTTPCVIRVTNLGATVAFVVTSVAGGATAALTDSFVGPNDTAIFSIPIGHAFVAVRVDTGTATVYVQRGVGS